MHWTEVVGLLLLIAFVVSLCIVAGLIVREYALTAKFTTKSREARREAVPGFGEFLVSDGSWYGQIEHPDLGEVDITFETTASHIPESQRNLARKIQARLPKLILHAVDYYASQQDAMPLRREHFDNVCITDDDGEPFHLVFALEDEHMTFVAVVFNDFEPVDFFCGD